MVFLREGAGERAERWAEGARAAAEGLETSWEGGTIRLTTSVGVAVAQAGVIGRDALIAEADAALYRAKGHGRNRVETARTGGESTFAAIVHRLARRASRGAG